MRDERGSWYLLTGFVLGLGFGLVYAWLISPVRYVDTSPASLRADFKDQYRALIAAAFAANGNLPRAQARLELLDDPDAVRSLAEQAQRTLAEGRSASEAQALGILAVALGQAPTAPPASALPAQTRSPSPAAPASPTAAASPPAAFTPSPQSGSPDAGPSPAPTGQTPTAGRTSLPTGEPLPTRTPTPSLAAPFVFKKRSFLCDQRLGQPLIQVLAEDARGEPVSGVEVIVAWQGGEEHFFTGLKPELGAGYADFVMSPGFAYSLRLAEGGEVISELTPAECETASGTRYWGSWLLVFSRR